MRLVAAGSGALTTYMPCYEYRSIRRNLTIIGEHYSNSFKIFFPTPENVRLVKVNKAARYVSHHEHNSAILQDKVP